MSEKKFLNFIMTVIFKSKFQKMKSQLFSILSFLILFSCSKEETATPTPITPKPYELNELQQNLVEELNLAIQAIPGTPLTMVDEDLLPLGRAVGSKSVVNLGEATHGTKEFFEMKFRVFRHLAENHGFRVFAIEADFGESVYFDRYIKGADQDLEDLMKNRMHFWTWRTREVQNFIEWMRVYNNGKNPEDQILYFGFDCQSISYQPSLLNSYLKDKDSDLASATLMRILETQQIVAKIENATQTDIDSGHEKLETLLAQFDQKKTTLIASSSEEEFDFHRQLLVNVTQSLQVLWSYETADQFNWRDQYMADNVLWLKDHLGPGTKIVTWAHNLHIANDKNFGSSLSLGAYLRRELGAESVNIGFGFSTGKFTAVGISANGQYLGARTQSISSLPLGSSFNILFHNAKDENFIVNLEDLEKRGDWTSYLDTPHPFLNIGSVFSGSPGNYYRSVDLDEHYDWMIYYKNTAASELF